MTTGRTVRTVRRDKLKRLVEAGRVELVGSYHFDDMTGERRSAGLSVPCKMMPADQRGIVFNGTTCYLYPSDFTSGSGSAWLSGERDGATYVTLYVHSNSHYDLRVKGKW